MDLHMEFPAAPLAPTLLNRAQLAQKIGARDNDYPRPTVCWCLGRCARSTRAR